MAKRKTRVEREPIISRFFFTVSTGVFTGLLTFFMTNCVLPVEFAGQVRTIIWRAGQTGEPRAPEDAGEIPAKLDEENGKLRSEPLGPGDGNGAILAQSVHIQAAPKDQMMITVSKTPTSDPQVPLTKRDTTSIRCNHEPTQSSPWVPVYSNCGPR